MSHMTYQILAVFILGYIAIALEHKVHINKAATALLIGTTSRRRLLWTVGLMIFNVKATVTGKVNATRSLGKIVLQIMAQSQQSTHIRNRVQPAGR